MLKAEEIKKELENLENQKNNFLAMFHQCVGAISVLNGQLTTLNKNESTKEQEQMIPGEGNGSDVDQGSD